MKILFVSHGDRERLAREIAPAKRRLRALLEPTARRAPTTASSAASPATS
ncbi:MAG TPA: hypothetical protein VKC63_07460 [Solirubrobacterales bacterium]|nr:hypothetical protein [Solirubrobacterales bacterium]